MVIPVSEFKFACPVCGQHLQARPGEAGQQIQCPSCFKKLIVPQAPAEGGGPLIISAALAESRRTNPDREGETRMMSASPPAPAASRQGGVPAWAVVTGLVLLVIAVVLAVTGGLRSGEHRDQSPALWTDRVESLQLMDTRAAGRLNGWDFEMTSAVWRDTSLFLRQDGGKPEGLRLRITFPLKGGDLVPGKTFRIGPSSPPFDTPIRIIWQDELGADHRESIASGYILLIRFDTVSTEEITGRVHLCLPDVAQSWVAGRFVAQNRTSTP